MALAPKIAGTSLVPIATSRHMIGGPVASTDSNALRELDEANPLYHEDTAFRYENFSQERRRQGQIVPQNRSRGQGFSNSLLSNSTASFATAFASNVTTPAAHARGVDYTTPAAMTHGVGSYEATSSVIHNEIQPLGRNLSVFL